MSAIADTTALFPRAGPVAARRLARWLRAAVLALALAPLAPLGALAETEDEESDDDIPVMSGLTIVGAKETPQSLILVPWKDSNVDVTTDFGSLVDSIEIEPVDRPTLNRRLLFDELTRADLKESREQAAREAAEQAEQAEQADQQE